MKRLNNKGYMLVEIILAFVLAMTIMYFITELTIKVKDKNNDLLVRSLTATDQAIIYNMVMKDYYDTNTVNNDISCGCETIETSDLFDDVPLKTKKCIFTYADKTVILNEYVDYCKYKDNTVTIMVNQLVNENFNVVIPS